MEAGRDCVVYDILRLAAVPASLSSMCPLDVSMRPPRPAPPRPAPPRREVGLEWVALEEDVLSLELPAAFKVGVGRCLWSSKPTTPSTHTRAHLTVPLPPLLLPPPPLLCQELCVDQDRSSLHAVARALHSLQQRWGTAPRVMAKGDSAVAGGWGGGGGAGGRQGGWVGERMAGGEQPPARVCSLLDPFPGLPAPLLCVS